MVCPADCKLRPQPGVFERGASYERDSPEPVRRGFGVVRRWGVGLRGWPRRQVVLLMMERWDKSQAEFLLG